MLSHCFMLTEGGSNVEKLSKFMGELRQTLGCAIVEVREHKPKLACSGKEGIWKLIPWGCVDLYHCTALHGRCMTLASKLGFVSSAQLRRTIPWIPLPAASVFTSFQSRYESADSPPGRNTCASLCYTCFSALPRTHSTKRRSPKGYCFSFPS